MRGTCRSAIADERNELRREGEKHRISFLAHAHVHTSNFAAPGAPRAKNATDDMSDDGVKSGGLRDNYAVHWVPSMGSDVRSLSPALSDPRCPSSAGLLT